MGKTTDETKRPLLRSERVRNYLIGLGAASGLILGILSQFKGEPVAEKTWETLRKALNQQATMVNKLQRRMVYFQAWQEARTAFEVQQKLDNLQKKYDALKGSKPRAAVLTPAPAPVAVASKPSPPTCKDGWVHGDDDKCHRVRRSVAARTKTVAKQYAETRRKLVKEQQRRRKAEHRKRELMRKLTAQSTDDLPALPAKLEDAKQYKK